jgi:hypothetical protein
MTWKLRQRCYERNSYLRVFMVHGISAQLEALFVSFMLQNKTNLIANIT